MLNFSQKLLKYVDTNASANEKNTEKLARSFVHRILRMIKSSLHNKGQNEGQVDVEKLYKNAALLHYLLARRGFSQNEMDKNKNKEIVQDIIRILIDNFIKQEMIKNFLIPTNYVILKTRRIAKNK
ncbi:MAG: hypothetical protein KatS3mg035_0374 [Bacteroidia bacterium]|nr:MAG: hypothetical protein KatS3mg035_0374 [Bacteroidia bacterium]